MFSSLFKNDLSYVIDVNSKIVYLKLKGEVATSSIIKIHKKVIKEDKFERSYNWIIDIRRSKQLFAHNKLDSLVIFFKKNANIFQNAKMAIIVGSPKQFKTIDSLINLFEIRNINIFIKNVKDKQLAYSWVLENTKE